MKHETCRGCEREFVRGNHALSAHLYQFQKAGISSPVLASASSPRIFPRAHRIPHSPLPAPACHPCATPAARCATFERAPRGADASVSLRECVVAHVVVGCSPLSHEITFPRPSHPYEIAPRTWATWVWPHFPSSQWVHELTNLFLQPIPHLPPPPIQSSHMYHVHSEPNHCVTDFWARCEARVARV